MNARLQRMSSDDQGTLGRFRLGAFEAWALEPPWRENRPSVSCIPPGSYRCTWRRSPRFGWTYCLQGTAPRQLILIHSGNFGGDVAKGWATHTHGCILLGRRGGFLENPSGVPQRAVLVSKPALRDLAQLLDGAAFDLEISQWT